jgi:regulator of cell morphogenesis and NO signaling
VKIRELKLGELVAKYPQALNFLDRMQIDLGFGDLSADEICATKDINSIFFFELLQLLIKKHDFNPKYINAFQPKLTIKYLQNSYKSYIEENLPLVENLINDLGQKEPERDKDCRILQKYFADYKKEFIAQLDYEESKIFPYILKLEIMIDTEFSNSKEFIENNSIEYYIKKHNSLNEKLNDLKSLLIKYFKPFKSSKTIRDLLKALYELEEDLTYRELIEAHILFPQVRKLEEVVLSNSK